MAKALLAVADRIRAAFRWRQRLLEKDFPNLDYIKSATIVPAASGK